MKNKIEIGQCYSYHDVVYEVVAIPNGSNECMIENTLTKGYFTVPIKELLTWRRPFQNFG